MIRPRLDELTERVRDIDAVRARLALARLAHTAARDALAVAKDELAAAHADLEREEAALAAWLGWEPVGDPAPAPEPPSPKRAPRSPRKPRTPEPPPAPPIAAPGATTAAERALTPGGDWLTDDDPAIRQWEVWLYTAAGYEGSANDAAGGLDVEIVYKAAKANRAVPIGTPTTTIAAVAQFWHEVPAAFKGQALAIVREHGKDADRCVDALRAMLAKGAA